MTKSFEGDSNKMQVSYRCLLTRSCNKKRNNAYGKHTILHPQQIQVTATSKSYRNSVVICQQCKKHNTSIIQNLRTGTTSVWVSITEISDGMIHASRHYLLRTIRIPWDRKHNTGALHIMTVPDSIKDQGSTARTAHKDFSDNYLQSGK